MNRVLLIIIFSRIYSINLMTLVNRVHIFSIDGLPGFQQAILATYPESTVQRRFVHQIRQSTRYISYKHIEALMADLKDVYKAPNEKSGNNNLLDFEENWGKLYPICVKAWKENKDVISLFFAYSENTVKKWSNRQRNWDQIKNELSISHG